MIFYINILSLHLDVMFLASLSMTEYKHMCLIFSGFKKIFYLKSPPRRLQLSTEKLH